MVRYNTRILKFGQMGEKTGWKYIVIPADVANKLNKGVKTSYRVKGKLDSHPIKQVALLPMGEGEFIIPMNATIRKAIGKKEGAILTVELELDKSAFTYNADFMACLKDEPEAMKYYKTIPGSHQKYYSKWIESAKTDATKAKRIAMAINGLARQLRFNEMLREERKKRIM